MQDYRRTLEILPEHLRKAFLDGDWNVFAGQYFDIFDYGRHTARPEEIRLEAWWPRWISIDWGFQHPSAVYWHCAVPARRNSRLEVRISRRTNSRISTFEQRGLLTDPQPSHGSRIVTYREFVQNGLSPRMLAQGIAERSRPRKHLRSLSLAGRFRASHRRSIDRRAARRRADGERLAASRASRR